MTGGRIWLALVAVLAVALVWDVYRALVEPNPDDTPTPTFSQQSPGLPGGSSPSPAPAGSVDGGQSPPAATP
jgi:hypothetical protein